MDDIPVYISGEDAVTKAIIERLLGYCSSRFRVFKDIPARGSQVKNKISELNRLAMSKPVILLTDLDATDCAPVLRSNLLNGEVQSRDFLINIAVDEGEAWLLADRKGFAEYLGVPYDCIPGASFQKMGGRKALIEMEFHAKSSWVLTHEIARDAGNSMLKQKILSVGTASKGPDYNSAVLPFIRDKWSIDTAMKNSDSLSRMIRRLKTLEGRFPIGR